MSRHVNRIGLLVCSLGAAVALVGFWPDGDLTVDTAAEIRIDACVDFLRETHERTTVRVPIDVIDHGYSTLESAPSPDALAPRRLAEHFESLAGIVTPESLEAALLGSDLNTLPLDRLRITSRNAGHTGQEILSAISSLAPDTPGRSLAILALGFVACDDPEATRALAALLDMPHATRSLDALAAAHALRLRSEAGVLAHSAAVLLARGVVEGTASEALLRVTLESIEGPIDPADELALAEMTGSSRPGLRAAAWSALARSGSSTSFARIESAIANGDTLAVEALAEARSEAGVAALERWIVAEPGDSEASKRLHTNALAGLLQVDAKRGFSHVRSALRSERAQDRSAALEALARPLAPSSLGTLLVFADSIQGDREASTALRLSIGATSRAMMATSGSRRVRAAVIADLERARDSVTRGSPIALDLQNTIDELEHQTRM